jgi:hypothetical protein
MASYHAMQVRDKFCRLLHGIKGKLPDTDVKLPYHALEKMALEDSDRRWT